MGKSKAGKPVNKVPVGRLPTAMRLTGGICMVDQGWQPHGWWVLRCKALRLVRRLESGAL